jgi:probable FeS assembly SUF system protein SufT
MEPQGPILLKRDVAAAVVPTAEKVTLIQGEMVKITQSVGGHYTVVVNGNMFRIAGQDADALGLEPTPAVPVPAAGVATDKRVYTPEELEKQMWDALRSCFDPEIPVNVVDLGLIYDCRAVTTDGQCRAEVKMTLTAPGCGMGPMIAQDVQNKLMGIEGIDEAAVELVWDPPWNQDMMTEAAKLHLGLL